MTFSSHILVLLLTSLPLFSSQACISYTEKKDFKATTGEAQATSILLDGCKALCFAHSNKCAFGFDYIYISDTIARRCFISLTSSTISSSGYTHYTCASTAGIITTAANQVNVVTTKPPGLGGVSFTWVITKNTNSPGGELKSEFKTLADCQKACLAARGTTCKNGIDYNKELPAGSGCYFAVSEKLNVGGYLGVDHYMYKSIAADAKCEFQEIKGKSSPGGKLVTSALTLDQCKLACRTVNNCTYGFDFNTKFPVGSRCYLSIQMNMTDYPGNSHYKYNCNTPCTWEKTENKNSPGGSSRSTYNTLEECQRACIGSAALENCKFGIDFQAGNPIGYRCFFGTQNVLTDFPGVNHYNPKCNNAGSGCSWKARMDKNTNSGNLETNLNTLDECKLRCKENMETNCKLGFDYVPAAGIGARCWFSVQGTLKNAPGINHYDYECTSLGLTTPPPNGCKFQKKAGKNTQGGIAQGSATTIDECKNSCLGKKDNDCKFGFDWSASSQPGFKCYFSKNEILFDYAVVDHYSLACGAVGECIWSTIADKNARGGDSQGFNTLDKCRDECFAQKDDKCKLGFDWQKTAPTNFKCWFAKQTTLSDYPGVTHYTLSCGGLTTGDPAFLTTNFPGTGPAGYVFIKKNNTYTPGGNVQAATNTLDSCKNLCITEIETNCKFGFDYNPTASNGLKCWFSNILKTYEGKGINHYNPVKTDVCAWVKQEDSNTANGAKQPDAVNTLSQCQSECKKYKATTCKLGLDWNRVTSKCYFSTGTIIYPGRTGIDHYSCSPPGGTTIVPVSTTLPSLETTTLPADATCKWIEHINKNSPSGEIQAYNTLSQCQTQCYLKFPPVGLVVGCPNGIDFDPSKPDGQKCFFSITVGTTNAVGVNHYTCPP